MVISTLDRDRNRDRLKAGVGVAVFHALLGYAFITGLGFEVVRTVSDSMKIFDVPEKPPPPVEEPVPALARTAQEEGAAAPPNIKSKASPVVAPPPKVRLDIPPPVVAAPLPTPLPGNDRSAGASDRPGPGTGAGGIGTGTGSGGEGARAVLVRGRLMNQDYPREAMRIRAEGTVFVRFTVRTDGRVENCRVTRSSGNEALDETTCRLIERRFRYEPARDAQGRAVPETIQKTYEWFIP
jgi:protein TonB